MACGAFCAVGGAGARPGGAASRDCAWLGRRAELASSRLQIGAPPGRRSQPCPSIAARYQLTTLHFAFISIARFCGGNNLFCRKEGLRRLLHGERDARAPKGCCFQGLCLVGEASRARLLPTASRRSTWAALPALPKNSLLYVNYPLSIPLICPSPFLPAEYNSALRPVGAPSFPLAPLPLSCPPSTTRRSTRAALPVSSAPCFCRRGRFRRRCSGR